MAQKLKFGGEGLPEGRHTWYEHATTGAIVRALPGDEVDLREVVNPEHYVKSGMATLQGAKEAKQPAS